MSNIFRFKGEVFEITKDFGQGYDQKRLQKYEDLMNCHKASLIENAGDQNLSDRTPDRRDCIMRREYIYDKVRRKALLDQACAQLSEKHGEICERIVKLEKLRSSKRRWRESHSDWPILLLKRQLRLLGRIKEYLETREEQLRYYETDQEREMAQTLSRNLGKVASRAQSSKGGAYRRWRSERFRRYKSGRRQKDLRGIHGSEKAKQEREFRLVWDRIYYKQEQINFEQLFRAFNMAL